MRRSIFPIVLCLLASCSDRTQGEDCWAILPPDAEPLPICGSTEKPETPAGLEGSFGPTWASFQIPAEADGSCQRCPSDELIEQARAQLVADMEEFGTEGCPPARVDHIVPGCASEHAASDGECYYLFWYWGACNIRQ